MYISPILMRGLPGGVMHVEEPLLISLMHYAFLSLMVDGSDVSVAGDVYRRGLRDLYLQRRTLRLHELKP